MNDPFTAWWISFRGYDDPYGKEGARECWNAATLAQLAEIERLRNLVALLLGKMADIHLNEEMPIQAVRHEAGRIFADISQAKYLAALENDPRPAPAPR